MPAHFVRSTSIPIAAALAIALSACGNDEPDPSSSNRGGDEASGETTVENAFIVPAYTLSCVVQVDAPAQLTFTAVNLSSSESETLESISTPAAESVSIEAPDGGLQIAPGTSIAFGQPVENVGESDAPDRPFLATLEGVGSGIQPGQSVPVTFTFTRTGAITFDIAVDACPTQTG